MMIEQSIFARSNAILSDQNFCQQIRIVSLEGLVKNLLDKGDRANKFCPIIYVFARLNDRWSAF